MADVQIDFDVPVPMADGTLLRADVYRPGGSGLHCCNGRPTANGHPSAWAS